MTKSLEYYRTLPYTKRVEREDEDDGYYFVVRVEELPGCIATGATRAEALANINTAFDEYIKAHLEWGDPIPEPERTVGAKIKVDGWATVEILDGEAGSEARGPDAQSLGDQVSFAGG